MNKKTAENLIRIILQGCPSMFAKCIHQTKKKTTHKHTYMQHTIEGSFSLSIFGFIEFGSWASLKNRIAHFANQIPLSACVRWHFICFTIKNYTFVCVSLALSVFLSRFFMARVCVLLIKIYLFFIIFMFRSDFDVARWQFLWARKKNAPYFEHQHDAHTSSATFNGGHSVDCKPWSMLNVS